MINNLWKVKNINKIYNNKYKIKIVYLKMTNYLMKVNSSIKYKILLKNLKIRVRNSIIFQVEIICKC